MQAAAQVPEHSFVGAQRRQRLGAEAAEDVEVVAVQRVEEVVLLKPAEATETIRDAANCKKCFKRLIAIEPFIEYFQKVIDETPPAVA